MKKSVYFIIFSCFLSSCSSNQVTTATPTSIPTTTVEVIEPTDIPVETFSSTFTFKDNYTISIEGNSSRLQTDVLHSLNNEYALASYYYVHDSSWTEQIKQFNENHFAYLDQELFTNLHTLSLINDMYAKSQDSENPLEYVEFNSDDFSISSNQDIDIDITTLQDIFPYAFIQNLIINTSINDVNYAQLSFKSLTALLSTHQTSFYTISINNQSNEPTLALQLKNPNSILSIELSDNRQLTLISNNTVALGLLESIMYDLSFDQIRSYLNTLNTNNIAVYYIYREPKDMTKNLDIKYNDDIDQYTWDKTLDMNVFPMVNQ